ncbi:MAG TPA: HemK2/MTQ2 family protein methyltransferase [Candidatus Nanoarchaeia archaeon]|nr:HemK2/MTQ2 family protein methyltransferase [Candidatus Nanoarchaeia archaeon]
MNWLGFSIVFLVKMSLIYSPKEDSYLLKEVLEKEVPNLLKQNSNLKVLEIGIGSGIQLKALEKIGVKRENIFGADINIDAVKQCQKMEFHCIKSNLFENINEKYDLIIFNPPYLPKTKNEDEESELITTGGKFGSEIINKFLEKAKKSLKEKGKIFLLVSSLTKEINWFNYKKELLGEKKLFFEKLETWELSL